MPRRVDHIEDTVRPAAPAFVPSKPTIVVLEHPYQKGAPLERYVLRHAVSYWREYFRVLRCLGTERVPAGDIGFLHVDQTVIGEEYLSAMARFPVAINARQRDISKRRISANLLGPASDWGGRVIAKSDLNSQGLPEAYAARLGAPDRAQWRDGVLPYRVFKSLGAVPAEIWNDPRYVVEKFLPERGPRGYYVRNFFFLGNQSRNFRQLSKHPIVKGPSVIWRERIAPAPEIRQEKEKLQMDFGKLDYVVHEGKVVLLDANRTPAWGHVPSRPSLGAKLGSGIWALLGREMPHAAMT